MRKSVLWSLRLGFTSKNATEIENVGLESFLKSSFGSFVDDKLPDFLADSPKSLAEIRAFRAKLNQATPEEKQKIRKSEVRKSFLLQQWWIGKMQQTPYPLREKMVCFWHNHFVSTIKKVKVNYWIYQHHMTLQKHAFGNFKELTKAMVHTNALISYLDNQKSRNNKVNENLSRELLELFTLGIGNYTENDIKNGARALAGLGFGDEQGEYRRSFENQDPTTYFGRTGNFDANTLVDIIFGQPNIPYFITEKILKWFIYDDPDTKLVKYYGDYFRSVNFEIQPLLLKIFTEEYTKENAGSRIKDPLLYILQLLHELNIENMDVSRIALFLRQQGMELFNQPNVKGWEGGRSWLTTQTYLQREKVADMLCFNKGQGAMKMNVPKIGLNGNIQGIKPAIALNEMSMTSKDIINELSGKLLFNVDDSMFENMQAVLKYDFDPKSEGAGNNLLRLFNYIVKAPEYQIL